MFTESSNIYNKTASFINSCVDLDAWTNPTLGMAYHMYGDSIGSLSVDVAINGDSTWTNLWTLSGD